MHNAGEAGTARLNVSISRSSDVKFLTKERYQRTNKYFEDNRAQRLRAMPIRLRLPGTIRSAIRDNIQKASFTSSSEVNRRISFSLAEETSSGFIVSEIFFYDARRTVSQKSVSSKMCRACAEAKTCKGERMDSVAEHEARWNRGYSFLTTVVKPAFPACRQKSGDAAKQFRILHNRWTHG